jgi:hypothetical protein
VLPCGFAFADIVGRTFLGIVRYRVFDDIPTNPSQQFIINITMPPAHFVATDPLTGLPATFPRWQSSALPIPTIATNAPRTYLYYRVTLGCAVAINEFATSFDRSHDGVDFTAAGSGGPISDGGGFLASCSPFQNGWISGTAAEWVSGEFVLQVN